MTNDDLIERIIDNRWYGVPWLAAEQSENNTSRTACPDAGPSLPSFESWLPQRSDNSVLWHANSAPTVSATDSLVRRLEPENRRLTNEMSHSEPLESTVLQGTSPGRISAEWSPKPDSSYSGAQGEALEMMSNLNAKLKAHKTKQEAKNDAIKAIEEWQAVAIREMAEKLPVNDKIIIREKLKGKTARDLTPETRGQILEFATALAAELKPQLGLSNILENELPDEDFEQTSILTSGQWEAQEIAVSATAAARGPEDKGLKSSTESDIANMDDLSAFLDIIDNDTETAWQPQLEASRHEKRKVDAMTEVERLSFLKYKRQSRTTGMYGNRSPGQAFKSVPCHTMNACITVQAPEDDGRFFTPYTPICGWGNVKKIMLPPVEERILERRLEYADDWKTVEVNGEYAGAKLGVKGVIAAVARNIVRATQRWINAYFSSTRAVYIAEGAQQSDLDKTTELALKYENILFNFNNEPDKGKYVIVASYAEGGIGSLSLYERERKTILEQVTIATTLRPKLMLQNIPRKVVMETAKLYTKAIKMRFKNGLPKFEVEAIGTNYSGPAATPITVQTCKLQGSKWKKVKTQIWKGGQCWKTLFPQSRYGNDKDERYVAASIPIVIGLMHSMDSRPTEYITRAYPLRYPIIGGEKAHDGSSSIIARAIAHIKNESLCQTVHRGNRLWTIVAYEGHELTDQVYAWAEPLPGSTLN